MNKDNLPENAENMENTDSLENPAVSDAAEDAVDTAAAADGNAAEESTADETADALPDDLTEDAEAPQEKEEPKKKKRSRANTRKFRFGAMATVLSVCVIAAVILLNVVVGILADRFPLNIDLTSDKTYTLSEQASNVIKSINKDVELVVFAEESSFENYGSGYTELDTILRQYHEALVQAQTLSGGKISVTYVNPNSPEIKKTYEKYEPEAGSTLLISGNNSKMIGFSDLFSMSANDYYGQSYTFTSKVELALATKLNAVAGDKNLVMTLFTGHDEESTTVKNITNLFETNGYTVNSMNLASMAEIDEGTSIAVIPAPSKDFTDEEIKRLREWMNNDGKLGRNLFVVVNYAADCPNLYEFLEENYGVTVTNNLVQETDTNKQIRSLYVPGVYNSLVDVQTSDLTKDLEGEPVLIGPTRQLLTAHGSDPDKESTINIPLLTYSDTARIIDWDKVNAEDAEDAVVKAESYPIVGMVQAKTWTIDNSGSSSVQIENNVLVCGGMDLFNSSYLNSANYANEDVALGAVNTICGNENAVKISTKVMSSDTLEFKESTANVLTILFVVVVPLVTLIICLVVFLRRRHL